MYHYIMSEIQKNRMVATKLRNAVYSQLFNFFWNANSAANMRKTVEHAIAWNQDNLTCLDPPKKLFCPQLLYAERGDEKTFFYICGKEKVFLLQDNGELLQVHPATPYEWHSPLIYLGKKTPKEFVSSSH